MEIQYIQIANWRSFYGENNFLVSTDRERNITLIRAENGVGKTSLLAAINWCFFNILPNESEFEEPSQLVNNYARLHDGVTKTTVQIDFIHEGKVYRASRSYDQVSERTHDLRLSELDNGAEIPSSKDRPDRFINSVIPREMAPHFFFYGEATSRYTGGTGARKFGEAVKGILGSTVARMALADLTSAMTDYRRQASDNTGKEAQDIAAGIERATEQVTKYQEEIAKLEKEIDLADDSIAKLDQALAGAKPAKDAQMRRTRLESRLTAKDAERARAEQRSRNWMERYATALLSEELVREAGAVIQEEDTRGKLPAPYDQKFVNELLEDEICVCGRPIVKGGAEYENIKTLLDTAGDQTVMSRLLTTSATLGRLGEKAKGAWGDYERNNEDLRNIEAEIQRLDAELVEISNELSSNPVEDISEMEAARERARNSKRRAENRKVECIGAMHRFESDRAELERKRDALIQKSEAARRYVKRAQLAAALTARLQARLEYEEEAARVAIEQDIDSIVQKFMRKPARVKLDKDYQLRLYDEKGSELAKSTGENQLLGLAFTGAIAKYAKARKDLDDDILLPGTIAPLVVDSPFGHLDPVYRRGVSEFLPDLASQVILLVSTSQASDAVMETLKLKIGHEYILVRHNESDSGGKPEEVVTIRDKTYDLTLYNSTFEGTQIQEVQ